MTLFPSFFNRFDRLLVFLGLATVVCMMVPRFAAVLATTNVLFPFAWFMAAIPAAFFFLVLVRLAMFLFPRPTAGCTPSVLLPSSSSGYR